MALVLRMVMIFAGAEMVERFHWILYYFRRVFSLHGNQDAFSDDDDFNP